MKKHCARWEERRTKLIPTLTLRLVFFLAQILNNGVQAWAKNREDRNEFYDYLTAATPEQQKSAFEIMQKTDPKLSERAQKKLTERGIDLNGVLPPAPQANTAGINQDTTRAMAQAAAKGLLGNPDFLGKNTDQPTAVAGDVQIIDFDPNGAAYHSRPVTYEAGGAQIIDFDPNGVVYPNHPATPEDYARVEHSVGADPAANIVRPSDYPRPRTTNYDRYVNNLMGNYNPKREEIPAALPSAEQTAPAAQPAPSNTLNLGSGYGDRQRELAQFAASQKQPQQVPVEQPQEAAKILGQAQFNPEAERLKRVVQDAKKRYAQGEYYYNRAATDEQRKLAVEMTQQAHLDAETARAQLAGMGYDTNGISEQTTIQDAYKNLASEKAQNIMQAMQGEYSKSSDDFYMDKYIEARARGLNPERAKRVAGIQAQRYQAGRVGHLNNLFNAYGFDGNAISPEGVRHLVEVARNDPLAAQIYMQMFAHPKDVFNHNNAVDLLNVGADHALTKAHNANEHEKVMEDKRHEQLKERLALQNEYTRALAELQASLGLNRDTGYYRNQKMIDQEFYQNPVQQTYDNYYNALINRGMSDQDAKAYAMSAITAPILQKGSGQQRGDGSISPDKQITSITGMYNAIVKQIENLHAQDPEGRNPAIQEEIGRLSKKLNEYQSYIDDVAGIQPVSPRLPAFAGDGGDTDQKLLDYAWNRSNGNMELYKEAVREMMLRSGMTPYFTDKYVRKLEPRG